MKLIRPLFIALSLGCLLIQTERMLHGIGIKWPEKRQSEMMQAHMLKQIMQINGGLCDGRFPMK